MSLSSAPRITEQNVNLGSPSGERKWEHHKGRPVNICPINTCISHTQKVTGILGALTNICWMNQWSREWINESIKLAFIESCFVGPCATYFVHTIALEFSKPCKKYYSPCWTDVRMEALLSYMPKVQKLLNGGWSSWTWAVHLLKLGPFSYPSSPDSPILDQRILVQNDLLRVVLVVCNRIGSDLKPSGFRSSKISSHGSSRPHSTLRSLSSDPWGLLAFTQRTVLSLALSLKRSRGPKATFTLLGSTWTWQWEGQLVITVV